MKRLDKNFFLKSSDIVARDILGKKICTYINGKLTCGIIVETESYEGFEDEASHGHSGITGRNFPIFEEGGVTYIYLIYGIYYLLNIVTGEKNFPSSIFIRAIEPTDGIEVMKERRKTNSLKNLTNGPAKLTLALGIDKSFNLLKVYNNDSIFILDNNLNFEIVRTGRIGISKAKNLQKRFYIKGSKWISTK